MSGTQMTDPFADEEEIDAIAASFKPAPTTEKKPAAPLKTQAVVKVADKVAADQGFTTRKSRKKPKFRRSDNLRTGRNELLSLKTRLEEKERLAAIANDREWVNGQVLQYALDALEEKIANPGDKFWETRNFHGVE